MLPVIGCANQGVTMVEKLRGRTSYGTIVDADTARTLDRGDKPIGSIIRQLLAWNCQRCPQSQRQM
jgi:hypothetical protein